MEVQFSLTVVHPSNDWYGSDKMLFEFCRTAQSCGGSVEVLLPIGSGTQDSPLVENLRSIGCDLHFASIPAVRRRELTPLGIIRLIWRSLGFTLFAAGRLRAQRVVVLNTNSLAHLAPLFRLVGIRTVGYLHEIPSTSQGRILALCWRASSDLIAISDAVKSLLPKVLQRRTTVIPNCAPQSASPSPLPPCGPLEFLFVGRLTPRKGVSELVDAFGMLPVEDYRLTVIGGIAELGAEIDLEGLRTRMAQFHVTYLGEVDDPIPYIDSSHVVVVPSLLAEGLGLTAIESLSRGRPVVATDVPGLNEVVDDSVGWLIDPRSPGRWHEVLGSLTMEKVERRRAHCLARFAERYSREAYELAVMNTLEGLI